MQDQFGPKPQRNWRRDVLEGLCSTALIVVLLAPVGLFAEPALDIPLNPDGRGWIGIGGSYTPGSVQQGVVQNSGGVQLNTQVSTQDSWTLQATGNRPIFPWLTCGLSGAFVNQKSDFKEVQSPSPSDATLDEQTAASDWTAQFTTEFFPASLAGRLFRPGHDANPDGWLGWPSLRLGYGMTWGQGTISTPTHTGAASGLGFDGGDNLYEGDGQFILVLPIALWSSLSVGYSRNYSYYNDLRLNFTNSGNPSQNYRHDTAETTGGTHENWAAGLSLFWAWSDSEAAYVPRVGFRSSVRLDLNWQREYDLAPGQVTQTWSVTAAVPVSDDLSFQGGVSLNQATQGPLDYLFA